MTLLTITRERYKVIMTPLAPRTKKLSMLKIIVLVWLIAALVSLPPALYSEHLSILNEYEMITTNNQLSHTYLL